MNLSITLLLSSADETVLLALESMLPARGRPLFEEDVEPSWLEIYLAIELLEPPAELKQKGKYLSLNWQETEHAAITLMNCFKRLDCSVLFVHSLDGEGDAIASDIHPEDDGLNGEYQLNVDGVMQALNKKTIKSLLPDYTLPWYGNFEGDVAGVVEYLINKA